MVKARSILAAVLLILLAAIAAAQQDTPSPTFRAGTKLVEVDVIARINAAPATALTKDDFTLLDNGKPRKIAFFSVQSGRVAAPPGADVPPLQQGLFRTVRSARATGRAIR